jgi:glycerol-3-phosphate dehydrogenase (NAD(P)+)
MTAEMTQVGVIGAGAFGTALALAQQGGQATQGGTVVLWGRDGAAMARMQGARENAQHLPGVPLPDAIVATADLGALAGCGVILLSIPTQALRGFLAAHGAALSGAVLVACCKGVERGTGLLPTQIIADVLPGAKTAVLTGPSFADDIARGKPTALTLATDLPEGAALQERLSTPAFRLYLSDDPVGAQLGGALKNVIALAAGMVIGAGLGESARAALMTRGFAEITRLAAAQGAHPETLLGLSGFGDLILTCSSEKSRNFSHGSRVARGDVETGGKTGEGVMTAHAVSEQGAEMDLPVIHQVSALLKGQVSLAQAMDALLQRPLKSER